MSGLVAALWCIGIGLALLTTVTLVGWIAAPKTALGDGLPGVFRTAANLWLVSHHAGFSYDRGRVGLLPLGILVLPGALLHRGGAWMIRGIGLPDRPRAAVVRVALCLAAPYAGLAGLLALAAASPQVRPSAWQAVVAGFVVAVVAGGLGAARAVVAAQVAAAARGERLRSGLGALLRLLPDRPRSLVIGVAGSLAVLFASGAVLVGASLAMNLDDADHLYDLLAPGVVGGVLLLMAELAFLPNAVIWGVAYAVGPGFSVGAGTSVSPTGVFLAAVPAFPPLAALPDPGPAPAVSLLALAAPFVAGAAGGVLTIRSLPAPVSEGAPMWGFVCGALTGAVLALLSALSGGPLGGGRMATVGPSPWQVGLLAALEVGIAAAIAAWAANVIILRRPARAAAKASKKAAKKAAKKRVGTASQPVPGADGTGRRARRRGRDRADERLRGPQAPAPVPLSAPVPGDYAQDPAPRSPYAPDPLEFEEADPLLTPRRARRRPNPPPGIDEEPPAREPAPKDESTAGDGTVVVEGHLVDEPSDEPPAEASGDAPEHAPGHAAGDAPHTAEAPERREVPPPREDPGRTENRHGAIYVLREDVARDDHGER